MFDDLHKTVRIVNIDDMLANIKTQSYVYISTVAKLHFI